MELINLHNFQLKNPIFYSPKLFKFHNPIKNTIILISNKIENSDMD